MTPEPKDVVIIIWIMRCGMLAFAVMASIMGLWLLSNFFACMFLVSILISLK